MPWRAPVSSSDDEQPECLLTFVSLEMDEEEEDELFKEISELDLYEDEAPMALVAKLPAAAF